MSKNVKLDPETVVVELVDGERKVPVKYELLVEEYVSHRNVVESCNSYPRWIDRRMNDLFDMMVGLVADDPQFQRS